MNLHAKQKLTYALLLLCQLFFFQNLQGQAVNYVPLHTASTLSNKTINTNFPVGAVVAQPSVQENGSANYSIPIVVPPGTNGVIPNISVAYNSQSGNGIMGQGWNITGLSAITRTGQSIYFDGQKTPVNFSHTDRFSLDGSRLIQKTGAYGSSGATYRTEEDNFATITSHGNMQGSPQWFKVEMKDGSIWEYGNRSDARFLNNSNTEVLIWRLSRISYRDGNYIDFYWTSDQRDNRIYEIKYTGNSITGQQPYNLVKFHYKTRTDQNTTYEHGNNVESRYLLDRIEVKAESSNVKTYEFKYSFDNFRSVLNSVAERGANGYSLNTTIFKYGDEPSGMSTVSSSIFAGTAVDLFSGDFDGDGYSDILTAPSAIYNGIRYNTHLQVYKRTATNPSFTQSYSTALPADFQVVNGVNRPNMYNFLASDYTGDGRDDIMTLKVRIEGSQNWRKLKEFKLYRSLGTTFTASIQYPAPGFDIVHPSWKYFYPGDFDGDGATDYITFLSNGTGYKAFVSFPRKAIYNQEVTGLGSGSYPATDWMNADYIYVIDFDGDGKQELMRIDEGMTYIHTFTQTGNTLNSSIVYQAGYPTKWHRLYFGDFNGDRKTDMLVRTSQTLNSASWEKAFSTGTNFVVSNFSFQQTPDIRDLSGDDKLVISDFNGDGLMDILHGWVDPGTISSTSTIGMYYSRGNDFSYETNAFDGLLGLVPLVTYDLNGDGRSDIINRTVYTSPFTIFYFKKEGRELLMESAVDGFLNRTNFDYRRMTQTAGGFYSKGGAPFHPVNNIQFPLYLTYQMRKDDGIGGEFVKRYSYGEAKLHKEGKGFLGFKYFNSTDLDHNSRMEHVKSLSTDYYALKPYRIEKYVNSTNDLLSKITISGEYTARPNMGYWYRINSRLENKYFEGQNTSTFYNYDNYGNRTEETIYQGNVFTRKTTITYGQHGTPVPSKPTTIDTWSQRNGQIAHSITSKYTYNSKGQVTQQEEFHGHPQEVTTTYTYHNLGPQKTVTVAASGLSSRTTTTNYDSKGRFVTQTINPLGQSSTATYDIKWGKPLTTTGVHGLTNSYEYDPFGRLTRTTRPEGHKLNESYLWFVSPSYGTTHYHQQQYPGRPDIRTFYDKLGRKKRTQTEGFQNQWISETFSYDSRGRMKTARAPFKQGESSFTTTYNYDTYNRVISEVNPFGTTSYNYNYNNGILAVTVTAPDGKTATTKTDITGATIEATDNGGTLTYLYNSQNRQREIRLGSTTMITNTFDVYGRKTQTVDKNAGTTSYTYNAFGEQTSHTTANGNTYNIQYNKLGQMIRRTGPDEDRTFVYFAGGLPAANKIRYAYNSSAFGGDAEFFFYDGYGRMRQLTTQIGGVYHQTHFDHNTYGDITKKTFPSGLDLDYEYDANGYLLHIKRGTTTLFTNQGMNGRNQYTSYKLGNNKTSTTTYNHGVPTRYYTENIQDLRVGWDYGNGNMTYRSEYYKGRFETFSYDNLNRLATSRVIGEPTKVTSYEPNGNIASKSDVGDYIYAIPKNNAVTRVTDPDGTIPTVAQDITYTGFNQPSRITEGNYELDLDYGNDQERIRTTLKQNGSVVATRYYIGEYEKQVKNGVTQHLHYVSAAGGTVAIIERKNNVDNIYYTYTDHLGSILTATDGSAAIQAEQNFDPWGRKRNVNSWNYANVGSVPDWLYRGFTAHEDLPEFGLINMNGRMYDPIVGRMLSVDNHIQSPTSTQNYNRYTYAFNNPLKFSDPSGEIAWAPIIIGAVVGAYSGGVIANGGNFNPFQWDFSAGRTWGYLLGGAVVGGLSAGLGHAVATSGMPMANTASIVSASYVNSVGMSIVTGGQTPVSMSFGIASYNFSTGEFGFLGRSGNSLIENVGYTFGAISNFNDVMVGFKSGDVGEVELVTEHTDKIGHSAIVEPGTVDKNNSIVSYGPPNYDASSKLFGNVEGTNAFNNHTQDPSTALWRTTIKGINKSKVLDYGKNLTKNTPRYNLYFSSCVTHTSRALMRSGFFNIGIHPYLLHAQVALREVGFRSYLYTMLPEGN